MMLAMENWETGCMEVAMLLDEAPNRNYLRGAVGGGPWRPDGPLAAAARTADLFGYAWLTVVFLKDDVRTWGQKRVRVQSGGRVQHPVRARSGVSTGELRDVAYEAVARTLFDTAPGVPASRLQYRVIQHAETTVDPELELDLGLADALLGFRVARAPDSNTAKPSDGGKVVRPDVGCKVEWVNEKGYAETWFLQDADGFARHRFELTEYQRRPFVADILRRLGLVRTRGPQAGPPPVRKHVRALLAQSCAALGSIATILTDASSDGKEAAQGPGNGAGKGKDGAAQNGSGSQKGQARSLTKEGPKAAAQKAGAAVGTAGAERNVKNDTDVVVLDFKDSDVDRVTGSDTGESMEVETQAPDFMAQFEPRVV